MTVSVVFIGVPTEAPIVVRLKVGVFRAKPPSVISAIGFWMAARHPGKFVVGHVLVLILAPFKSDCRPGWFPLDAAICPQLNHPL